MADVTVDHKGRIALPPWAVKILGAKSGKPLLVHSEGNRIVLERNTEAIGFYERLGAQIDPKHRLWRLDRDALETVANPPSA